MVKILTKTRKN